jgi:hypothetical protein
VAYWLAFYFLGLRDADRRLLREWLSGRGREAGEAC